MRIRSTLVPILLGTSFAAAQPAEPPPVLGPPPAPPEETPAPPPAPAPAPAPAPPAPAPAPPPVVAPPGTPITININNSVGTNTNTNSAPTTVSTPVTTNTSTPVTTTNTASPAVTTTIAPPAAPVLPPVPPAPSEAVQHCPWTPPTVIERVATAPERHRWLLVGGIGNPHDHEHGMRASIDLLGRGKWSFGVAATFTQQGDHERNGFRGGRGDGRDGSGRVVAYVARTRQIGRIFLRGEVGLGFAAGSRGEHEHDREPTVDPVVARSTTEQPPAHDGDRDHHRGSPVAEASLMVGLPLGKHLGIIAGPVISAQHFDRDHSRDGKEHEHDVAMFAGLMWRR